MSGSMLEMGNELATMGSTAASRDQFCWVDGNAFPLRLSWRPGYPLPSRRASMQPAPSAPAEGVFVATDFRSPLGMV